MKLYERCPICDSEFVNKTISTLGAKSCPSKDHRFSMISKDSLASFAIHINDELSIIWFFGTVGAPYVQAFNSDTESNSHIDLPFFEPDFSDYPKLIEKIKTYVVFA